MHSLTIKEAIGIRMRNRNGIPALREENVEWISHRDTLATRGARGDLSSQQLVPGDALHDKKEQVVPIVRKPHRG